MAQFYTTERLGPKQSLTPEGFLLCEEVPIARTGFLIYGPDETPIEPGPGGFVKIYRDPEEVFHPDAMASFMGKPATNDHPDEDVTPENWRELAVGTAFNIRRGVGAMDDLLLADLLITCPVTIKLIQEGKREVSCGYEADYDEIAPGAGRQTSIRGNHIALVESGRCGPRCAISDHSTINQQEAIMAKKKASWYDRLKVALSTKDEAEVEELMKSPPKEVHDDEEPISGGGEGGDTHIHVHTGGETAASGEGAETQDDPMAEYMAQNDADHQEFRERLEALEAAMNPAGGEDEETTEIEGALKEEAPEGTDDEEVIKAKDSRYLGDSFRDTASRAEILVPGIRIPAFDSAAKPVQSYKKICGLRRTALDLAYSQADTRGMIDDALAGKTLDTKNMTCDAVRHIFLAASAMKKNANNAGGHRSKDDRATKPAPGIKTIADLNKANAKHWA
jgi:hypothetical protein